MSVLATRIAIASFLTVGISPAVFGQAQDIRCDYKRKFECSASGCEETTVGGLYLLLPRLEALRLSTIRARGGSDLPVVRRCDAKGCNAVTVRVELSGAFTNISSESGGYFLKFASADLGNLGPPFGEFVEVASVWLSTITYFGSCPAVAK
jgi:hypothetical protein